MQSFRVVCVEDWAVPESVLKQARDESERHFPLNIYFGWRSPEEERPPLGMDVVIPVKVGFVFP